MSTTPDYGEPWKEKAYNYTVGDSGDVEGVIEILTREELKVAEAWNPSDVKEAFFSRAVACVNACAGMADPAAEIEVMRAVVKGIRFVAYQPAEVREALAKLKPFIKP